MSSRLTASFIACLVAGLLVSCKATVPSGIFACSTASDCPESYVCRTDGKSAQKYCFAGGLASVDGGVSPQGDAGMTADDGGSHPATGDAGTAGPSLIGGFVGPAVSGAAGGTSVSGRFAWHSALSGASNKISLVGSFK